MLTVTEAASAHLAQLLEQHNLPDEVAVRFVYENEGIALQQDSERPGDTKFQHEDRTVLLLDPQMSELLNEGTLDVDGASLTLHHPQQDE